MSQLISTIRQRWQLTIPDRVREKYDWVVPGSPVAINTTDPNRIVIEPYSSQNKKVDWDKFWKDLKRIRSYKGNNKSTMSSTKLLVKDRETHF